MRAAPGTRGDRATAGWWSEDKLTDNEFIEALEFLIDSDIIQLGDTIIVSSQEWEKKYNESEQKLITQSQKDTIQHEKLYAEVEEKYELKENKILDELNGYIDVRNAKIDELTSENRELKKKLFQAGIGY